MNKLFQKIKIAFFSGTGCTQMVAQQFSHCFLNHGFDVQSEEIKYGLVSEISDNDYLIVFYPVHALNAPEPVYRYIDSLKSCTGGEAAVISVSGGGEVFPNTACRVGVKKRLKRKGFCVRYENMIVMPSNCIEPTDPFLCQRLIDILPVKAKEMVSDIVSGTPNITRPPLRDRILSKLCELEKVGAHYAGKRLFALDSCTGCEVCFKNCPAKNIEMLENRPAFGKRCALCLKCIYACPTASIKFKFQSAFAFEEGFNLEEIKAAAPVSEKDIPYTLEKSRLWKGVLKYLKDF